MTVDALSLGMMSAIAALASAVVALYKRERDARAEVSSVKLQASNMIFALLQKQREERGDTIPPPTASDWNDEPTTAVTTLKFQEATEHAAQELNGSWQALVKKYLSNTATPKPPAPKTEKPR